MLSIPAVRRAAAAAVLFAISSPLCLMGNCYDGSIVSRVDSMGVYGLKLSMRVGLPQTNDEAQANNKVSEQLQRLVKIGKFSSLDNWRTLLEHLYGTAEALRAAVLTGEVEVLVDLVWTGRYDRVTLWKARAVEDILLAYGGTEGGLRAAVDAGEIKQLVRLLEMPKNTFMCPNDERMTNDELQCPNDELIKTVPEWRTLLENLYGGADLLRAAVLKGEVELLVDLMWTDRYLKSNASLWKDDVEKIVETVRPLGVTEIKTLLKYYNSGEELRTAVLSGEVGRLVDLMWNGSGRFGNLQWWSAAVGDILRANGGTEGLRAALDAGETKQLARLLGVTDIKTLLECYNSGDELRTAVRSGEVELLVKLMRTGSGRFGNLRFWKAAVGDILQAYGGTEGLRAALDAGGIEQLVRLLGVTDTKTLLECYKSGEELRTAVLSGEVEVLVDLLWNGIFKRLSQWKAAARKMMEINKIKPIKS